MTIDLEGSSPQMEGPVNCGFAQTVSACRVAFKLLINPERPVDGGTFKTLDVKAPPGSIFDAQEPAACQWYFSSLGLLDRPGRDGARAGPARQGGGRALRRLDGDVPRRKGSAPRRPALPLRDAARRRLGRVRGRRRRGRADQQRQRRLQGLPGRGVRGEVPGADPRLRLPARHRRPGRFRGGCGLYRTLRGRARRVPLPLVRALGDTRLGTVRGPATRSGPTSSSTRAGPTSGTC